MRPDKPGFLEELKRRHVWRVAVAYLVAAWLLVQIATQVFPFFHIPDWSVRLVVILLAIGFPVAVAFAWIYELTPEGLRRTEPADSPAARPQHTTRQIGRKLNAAIIAALVLAIALLGWRLMAVRHAPVPAVAKTLHVAAAQAKPATPATRRAATAPPVVPIPVRAIPAKSVAVLPFVNESGQTNQQFFSDGLSEDLITALSQFAGLKVISRNSAFQFRNSKDTSAKIGQLLGVAHLLEGSVQRAGDEVRITATLVDAANGTTLWSKHYDKPYKDLFALQDAITKAVAGALKTRLLTAPGAVVQSDRPPSGNLAAYASYQHGNAYVALQTEAGLHHAITAFNDALRVDPKYAAAYAQLSGAWDQLVAGFLSDPAQVAQGWANARKAAATALKLDSDLALAHEARGNLLLNAAFDWTGAQVEYRRALQLAPSDALAQFNVGFMLAVLGQVRPAVAMAHKALVADPRNSQLYEYLSKYLAALGQDNAARQAIDTAITLQPGAASYHNQLAITAILSGNPKAALGAARAEPDPVWRSIALALALQVGPDHPAADAALHKLIKKYTGSSAYQIAEVYALRHDPNDTFKWLNRAWANRDPGIAFLLLDPLILRYRQDPRFAAFCKKVGLPDATDAVAMK